MMNLNLLVLRCRDLERARSFYECLGLMFEKHRHGNGPEHFAADQPDGVLELYPATADQADDGTGLGFSAGNLTETGDRFAIAGFAPGPIADRPWGRTFVIRDPDNRRIELKQI